jgi:hypothetical protein
LAATATLTEGILATSARPSGTVGKVGATGPTADIGNVGSVNVGEVDDICDAGIVDIGEIDAWAVGYVGGNNVGNIGCRIGNIDGIDVGAVIDRIVNVVGIPNLEEIDRDTGEIAPSGGERIPQRCFVGCFKPNNHSTPFPPAIGIFDGCEAPAFRAKVRASSTA